MNPSYLNKPLTVHFKKHINTKKHRIIIEIVLTYKFKDNLIIQVSSILMKLLYIIKSTKKTTVGLIGSEKIEIRFHE